MVVILYYIEGVSSISKTPPSISKVGKDWLFRFPSIVYQYRRFFFDIEKNTFGIVYYIVHYIVNDIIHYIGYKYLIYYLAAAGQSLQCPENSDSEEYLDRQMDYDDLSDHQDLLLPHYCPSQATGPVSKFLVDMPGLINLFNYGLMKALKGLPMPEPGSVPPGIILQDAIEVPHGPIPSLLIAHACLHHS